MCFDVHGKRVCVCVHAIVTAPSRCFCGRWKDDYNEHGPAICSMPCTGDSGSICGGNKAMSVFRIKD